MMATQDIAVKNQWNKLVLYTAGDGWNARLCKKIPSVCDILRGKLRTESGADRRRYDSGLFTPNDEAVIIFRVAAGGMAHLHNGQVKPLSVLLLLLFLLVVIARLSECCTNVAGCSHQCAYVLAQLRRGSVSGRRRPSQLYCRISCCLRRSGRPRKYVTVLYHLHSLVLRSYHASAFVTSKLGISDVLGSYPSP